MGEHGSSGLEFHPSQLPSIVKSATIRYIKETDIKAFESLKETIADYDLMLIHSM